MKSIIPNKTIFRSGCSTRKDLVSFRIANQVIGSSIDYFKASELTANYPMAIQEALLSKEAVFLDNGLIQSVTNGTPFVPKLALARYKQIVDTYKNSRYLTLVVPDSPTDEDEAYQTIKDNKEVIKYLLGRCRVMIPIHRTKNITLTEQVLRISKELDGASFTLGIPSKTQYGWRLTECEITELLSIKRGKKPLFNDVHFLGMCEVSGKAYALREQLCDRFGVTFSTDASRLSAIHGKEHIDKKGKLVKAKLATRKANSFVERMTEVKGRAKKFMWDRGVFAGIDYDSESDDPIMYDFLQGCEPEVQYHIFNTAFPQMAFTGLSDDYADSEWHDRLFEAHCFIGREWEPELKKLFFSSDYETVVCNYYYLHKPTSSESRRAGIVESYIDHEDSHIRSPVQGDLFCDQEKLRKLA